MRFWIGWFIFMAAAGLHNEYEKSKRLFDDEKISKQAEQDSIVKQQERDYNKLFVESMRKIRSKGIRIRIKTHKRPKAYGGGHYYTYHIDNWEGPYNKDGIIEYASNL